MNDDTAFGARAWTGALLLLAMVGCGSAGTVIEDAGADGGLTPTLCPGPGCTPSGGVFLCASGFLCTLPMSGDVDCAAGSTCVGTCAGSCDVDCTMGATCDIMTGESSSSSCDMSTCTVVSGASTSYTCTNGSTCDVTMGASSSATCDGGSECQFTCTASCGIECRDGSECTVQCAADSAPRSFTGAVACE